MNVLSTVVGCLHQTVLYIIGVEHILQCVSYKTNNANCIQQMEYCFATSLGPKPLANYSVKWDINLLFVLFYSDYMLYICRFD